MVWAQLLTVDRGLHAKTHRATSLLLTTVSASGNSCSLTWSHGIPFQLRTHSSALVSVQPTSVNLHQFALCFCCEKWRDRKGSGCQNFGNHLHQIWSLSYHNISCMEYRLLRFVVSIFLTFRGSNISGGNHEADSSYCWVLAFTGWVGFYRWKFSYWIANWHLRSY